MAKYKRMIIVKLEGGLGNQMFQLAIGRILAEKNKTFLTFDKTFFDNNKRRLGHTPRNYELKIFVESYPVAGEKAILVFHKLSIINRIKKKLGLNYPKTFRESSFNFNSRVLNQNTPIYLRGFFQSYKYFQGYEELIKKIFVFPQNRLEGKNIELLNYINNNQTLAIHVRRGDYVKDKRIQQYHGNLTTEYYLQAISAVVSKIHGLTLIFFSDDTQWVKEEFQKLDFPKKFVDYNSGENSWKDMFLMSCCKHQIIANSSFSWWAAWLNENPTKIVIAPKKWFEKSEKDINTKDLIPPKWIRI